MAEKLLKAGWIRFSDNGIYFKQGWFIRLDKGKIVDFWRSTVFYKIPQEKVS